MKKSFARSAALLLSVLIAMSAVLAGCGKKNDSAGNESTGSSAQDPAKKGPPVTLKYLTVEHANWPVTNDSPVLKEIEKKTNVKIEYMPIPGVGFEEKFNTIMASGDLPDLMNLAIGKINEYGPKVFVALDELVQKNGPNLKKILTPDVKVCVIAEDKKFYGIPRVDQPKMRSGWLIRKDWLDKLNLKMPETIEDWEKVMRAFKDSDPDGNGKNDTIPWVPHSGSSWLMFNVVPSFGLHSESWTEKDGKLLYNVTTSQYKDALVWLNKMYKEGLLDKEFAVISTKQWEERMTTNIGGSTTSYIARTDVFTNQAVKSIPGYSLVACKPLKGPDGKMGAPTYSTTLASYCVAITKNCKNQEAAIKYIDYLFSDEGNDLTTWGVEGVSYTVKDGKKVWNEEIQKDPANMSLQAKYGIMQQQFPRRMNPAENDLIYGKNTKESLKNIENFYVDAFPFLTYTKDEQGKMKDLGAAISPIINQYTDKFIMGELPISDWDKFQAELKKLGVDEYIKIQNDSFKRYKDLYNSLKK